MSKFRFNIVVAAALYVFEIQLGLSDVRDINQTTEALFNLTNYAIESRRIRNACINEVDYNYFFCVQKLIFPNKYGSVYLPNEFENYQKPHRYRPSTVAYQNPQNLMEILHAVATHDALRCVPRLLCEVTSDTVSRNRQGFTLPTLPFNIDTKSIISLLSIIDLPGGSPIPFFAKAALLGYISKGNTDSCFDAYPTCPRDPSKLIHYLNNYNGGFFKFFSGMRKPISQNYGLINYPHRAQRRILNKQYPSGYVLSVVSNRLPKRLAFPQDDDNYEFNFKKLKESPLTFKEDYYNELDLQRPLPNHKATPTIFPTRTGTGDLRLDLEELNQDYKQSNNFVKFDPPSDESPKAGLNYNRNIFSFPV